MKRYICLSWMVLAISLCAGYDQAEAGNDIHIRVRTVLASQDGQAEDPGLSDLIRELRTVFKYSSYRLLGQHQLQLALNKTGTVSLPDNRFMKITPLGIAGDRAELRLEIFKQNRQVFQTVIRLLNHASMTVGGPEYKGGYLLFNIGISYD